MLPELFLQLAIAGAEAADPAAQAELQAELDTTRAKIVAAPDRHVPKYDLTDETLVSIMERLGALYELERKVFLNSYCEHLSFKHEGVQGQLKCMSSGGVELKRGEDVFYFEPNYKVVYINELEFPITDQRFLEALDFTIAGLKGAIANPKFTSVDSGDATVLANKGALLKSPSGRIDQRVAPGTLVAIVGTVDSEGNVFSYVPPTEFGQLATGWLRAEDLAGMEPALPVAPAPLKAVKPEAKPAPAPLKAVEPEVKPAPAPVAPASSKTIEAPAPEAKPAPTPLPAVKPEAKPAPAPLKAAEKAKEKLFVSPDVNSNGGLNVRNAPDGSPTALTTRKLPKDTGVSVVARNGKWAQVLVDGETAPVWVSGDYLVSTKGAAAKIETAPFPEYQATVMDSVGKDGLNLRDKPKISADVVSSVIAHIPAKAIVTVTGVDGDWAQITVTLDGKKLTGVVAIKYLARK